MDKEIYLITGASSDLGICYIRHLDNCTDREIWIYGTYNSNGRRLNELSVELKHVVLIPIKCDLIDANSVENMISEIMRSDNIPGFYLHLAASKFEYMRIKAFDWTKTKQDMDIQVGAFAIICRFLLPYMAKNRFGRVVAVLTAYTLGVPPKFMSNYIVSKYALLGFVKAAASEYVGKNVNINAISPNMMETKFLSSLDSRQIEMNAKNCAMQRNVELREVIEGISYLMNENTTYVTGVNLNMSGGDAM